MQSPNGSTIILYGYETGVKILWIGGRPFKTSRPAPAPTQKTNGSGAVISLDSDDDGDSSKPFDDKPEFEDDEEDLDPSRPYSPILQVLDLCFNTDVLHLAILPPSILQADGPSWRGLESLKQKLVFVAACADNSVRLVTLPLTPPSPASKARTELRTDFTSGNAGKGKWGETVTTLSGHQKPSDGITITANPVGGPGALVNAEASTSSEPHLVVASHSREVTGILRLYRIPIKSQEKNIDPFQSISLLSPAKAISFNPALSQDYTSRLLVADSVGACRIYDYALLSRASEEPSETPMTEYGTWLVSFYTGFQDTKSDSQVSHSGAHVGFGRKLIVDAQWVSGGKAILVLIEDGEWAILDVEGSGPNASQGTLGRQGVTGGSKSGYSLSGYLDISSKSRSSAPPPMSVSKFAPMTPGTRRTIDPFGARGSTVQARGQISVMEMPPVSSTSLPEESILFWLGDTYAVIPSLAKYWSAHKTGGTGNLFSGPTGARMIKFENIDLQGERCSGVEQIPRDPSTGPASDILILAEHRFTILTTAKSAKPTTAKQERRLVLAEKSANGGDLDVTGIDEALSRMENNSSRRKIF
jgi:hypothetical protein